MVLISNLLLRKRAEKFQTLFDDENPYKTIDDNFVEYTEKHPIKGMPLRRSFKFFPKEKKEYWRSEASDLRWYFLLMGIFHVFCLVYCDIYVYGFEISAIIIDTVMIWLDLFNYMTLNRVFMIT